MAYTARPGSWLGDVVLRVWDYTNEPIQEPKWTEDKIWPLIVSSWEQIMLDVNGVGENPVVVRYDLVVDPDTLVYQLPPHVGEVLRFGKVDGVGASEWVSEVVVPRSRLNPCGAGVQFEGPTVRFSPSWQPAETLRVEFVPSGHCSLAYWDDIGTIDLESITLTKTPESGYLDRRPNSYVGCLARVLSYVPGDSHADVLTGIGIGIFPTMERIIATQSFLANTNEPIKVNVVPNFDYNVSLLLGGLVSTKVTVEIVPFLGEMFKDAVAWKVAATILGVEGKVALKKEALSEYALQMRLVRLRLAALNARTGSIARGDMPGNGRFGLSSYGGE